MWFVSRQHQWPDGNLVVEINSGGRDYANPDMLSPKFQGEGQEYNDPREAVEIAIEIAKNWQESHKDEEITIAYGATAGFTMPFDGESLNDETFKELKDWANKVYEKLPKCDHCNELLPEKSWRAIDAGTGEEKFCSEYCTEEFCEAERKLNEEYQNLENAVEEYKVLDTKSLKRLLKEKKKEFKNNGGRGVELADEIDTIETAIGARKVKK